MIALDKLRTLGLSIILAWGWKRAAIALAAGALCKRLGLAVNIAAKMSESSLASAATVHRDIRLARAWLLNEIGGARPA